MNKAYQRVQSAVLDLDSTSSLLIIPLTGSCQVVEFGVVCTDTADLNACTVKLQYVDGAGNATDIATCTATASSNRWTTTRKKVDVSVEKANDKYTVNGTVVSDTDGIAFLQVKVTSAGDANSNGVLYADVCHSGSQIESAHTTEVLSA